MTVEKAFKALMIDNPFYGFVCLNIAKRESTNTDTASVAVTMQGLEILVNPDFFATLKDTEQVAEIKHEVMHIAMKHVVMADDFDNRELFNIAADMEVNSYNPDMHAGCTRAALLGFPEGKGTKWYYEQLLKTNPPQQGNDDDHSMWGNFGADSAVNTIIGNQIDSILKIAAEETERNCGTIPGEMECIITELFKPKKVKFNWRNRFRSILTNMHGEGLRRTRRKPSKRFEDSSAITKSKGARIAVAIDVSGSVNNDEIIDFMSEITHIYRMGTKVTILECDADVQKVYEYNGKWDGKVHGRGGTVFDPALKWYNERRKDYCGFIYFTDGFASEPSVQIPRGMYWVITSCGSKNFNIPGKVLRIPKTQD